MDYEQLKVQLATMSERSKLFEMVKNEMITRGRWKAKPRGKAFNRGNDYRRKAL